MTTGMPSSSELYPRPSTDLLKRSLVGKNIREHHSVPMPAAILDRAILKRNCDDMLGVVKCLGGVRFRPHIKTHKTVEITRLQVGEETPYVNIIVSTHAEAEMVSAYLLAEKTRGRTVNLLYGVPLSQSRILPASALGYKLGADSITFMIDDPQQLQCLPEFVHEAGFPARIFVKVDAGYHRAGRSPSSGAFKELVEAIAESEAEGSCILHGFYSHAGQSYSVSDSIAALGHLDTEINEVYAAARIAHEIYHNAKLDAFTTREIVLSVGATPSATSIKHYVANQSSSAAEITQFSSTLTQITRPYILELHAGVYPMLDIQQEATQASPSPSTGQQITRGDVAFTILTEVTSVYNERSPLEVMIAAGSLALGREPCKSYDGWGMLSAWNTGDTVDTDDAVDGAGGKGWKVARVSQEHGILQEINGPCRPLSNSQRVRVFPNHACIAGAGFSYYLVVEGDVVVDVWVRCNGW